MAETATEIPPITTPPPSDTAPAWRAGLPPELASDPSLAAFKDVGALAKSYVETKKLVGKTTTISVPDDSSTPEQIAAYRKALGVPDAPTGYSVRRPDVAADGEWDDATETAFLGKMHELGVPPKVVQSIIDWYGISLANQQNGWRRESEAAQQELRTDWGPNYDANLGRANRAIQQYGGDALVDLFARTGVGRHPAAVRAFAKIGNDLVEHGAMPADHIGHVSPEEAREKLAALQKELVTVPRDGDRAKAIINEIVAVTKIAAGRAA